MTLVPMSARYQRPDWVRRLNAMADSVGDPEEGARRIVPLDGEALLACAEGSLGGPMPHDLGDPHWRGRFLATVAAMDDAPLHVVGRLQTRQELLRALRTRHLLAGQLAARPETAQQPIEAPVIVTGPARSGTTILFELLALDPALRAPVAWRALHPVPLPDAPEDHRRLATECEQELWAEVQPEFAAIHELRSDLPVECVTLTAPSFCGPHWPMVVPAAAVASEPAANYGFHRRILQALQQGEPEATWLLKTPAHLATIDLLFETYPDAWVVQTHRDPARTMPSTVSTTAMLHWLRTEHVEIEPLAAGIEAVFGAALNEVAERRRKGTLPDRFVDVHFQELMHDPVGTLRAAYEGMGRGFGPEHAERVTRYLAEKPKGKFGVHRYTPEAWGFDRSQLRRRLAPYIETFGVALED